MPRPRKEIKLVLAAPIKQSEFRQKISGLKTRVENIRFESEVSEIWNELRTLRRACVEEMRLKVGMQVQDHFQNFLNGSNFQSKDFKTFIERVFEINKIQALFNKKLYGENKKC